LLLPEEKSFDDLFVSFHGNLDDRLVQIKLKNLVLVQRMILVLVLQAAFK
jgi:hypothetical protein